MSAALERLKQQNEPGQSQQRLGSPETTEVLTSVLAAVEAQNTRIETLAKQQKKLAKFLKAMDEELTNLSSRASTSEPSAAESSQIASVENRLVEIESTLSEFASNLDGKQLQSASQSLIAEAQKSRTASASATERLTAQAQTNKELVTKADSAMQRIERRTEEHVAKAVEHAVGKASATMTENLDASNKRAERVIAATAKLEARQLWSAAAAMCLTLLPVALVIAGVWMSVAGVITGVQWALDVDGSVWLGIGRWSAVGAAIAGVGCALVFSARWVAGLVGTWRDRGMPSWPRWRE